MTEENNTHNDLDNDLLDDGFEVGLEWIAAHLLAIIIFLENKFGNDAGHIIGEIASNLLTQFKEDGQDSE